MSAVASVRATPAVELHGDALKRFDWALTIGLDPVLAELVASDWSCDLHRVHELLQCSCDAVRAVELATPVR